MTEQRLGSAKRGVGCIYEVWDNLMICCQQENRYHWAKLSTAGEVMRYK